MNTNHSMFLWVVSVVALVISIAALFYPKPSQQIVVNDSSNLGSVGTTLTSLSVVPDEAGNIFSVGTTSVATGISAIYTGGCNLIIPNASAFTTTASSTRNYDCAVSGVSSGDIVLSLANASSTAASSEPYKSGWLVLGASASSTPGFVSFKLANESGVTSIPPSYIASSTKYLVLRPNGNAGTKGTVTSGAP